MKTCLNKQMNLFDMERVNLAATFCSKGRGCGWYVPREFPNAAPDGLCERMPKITTKSKRPTLVHPTISTMAQCPILSMGGQIPPFGRRYV